MTKNRDRDENKKLNSVIIKILIMYKERLIKLISIYNSNYKLTIVEKITFNSLQLK